MNFSHPLELIDGCLFMDHSSLEYVVTCARSAYFHVVKRRRGAAASPGLNFGGAMHEPLAYRYRECPDLVSPKHTAKQHDMLKKWFAKKPNPVEDHRQLDLAIALNDEYNNIYTVEAFRVAEHKGKPAVELPFAYELFQYTRLGLKDKIGVDPITVFWMGRIDLVVEEEGQVFTVDHKTSSKLGDGFFRGESMSGQHRGYAWAYQQEYGKVPDGYIINAIRVPKPTIKGGLGVKADGFQRAKYYLDEEQIREWKEETVYHISHFLDLYLQKYFPAQRKWCVNKFGTCQYYDVCSLNDDGSRETMLDSGMYAENEWSPLYPTEPKKLYYRILTEKEIEDACK